MTQIAPPAIEQRSKTLRVTIAFGQTSTFGLPTLNAGKITTHRLEVATNGVIRVEGIRHRLPTRRRTGDIPEVARARLLDRRLGRGYRNGYRTRRKRLRHSRRQLRHILFRYPQQGDMSLIRLRKDVLATRELAVAFLPACRALTPLILVAFGDAAFDCEPALHGVRAVAVDSVVAEDIINCVCGGAGTVGDDGCVAAGGAGDGGCVAGACIWSCGWYWCYR